MFTRNVVTALSAILSQSIAIFIVLWMIRTEVGPEQLGIWALFGGLLSTLAISDFGIGMAMVHHSQKAQLKDGGLNRLYSTAMVTIFLIFIVVSVSAYYPLCLGIEYLVDFSKFDININHILLLVLSTGTLVSLSKVPLSTLNSLNLFSSSQIAIVFSNIFYVIISYIAIRKFGLVGAFGARLGLAAAVCLSLHLIVFGQSKMAVTLVPRDFCTKTLRSILKLSMSFQLSSFLLVFFEPVAKIGIAMTGDLASVGFYEMGSRMASFLREIFARPLSFLSGSFSRDRSKGHGEASDKTVLLSAGFELSTFVSLLMVLGFSVFLIPAADFWVGGRNDFFLLAAISLHIGWLASIFAIIPYYYCVGMGENRPNLVSTFLIAAITVLGCAIAYLFGMAEIIPLGVSFALIVAHIVMIRMVRMRRPFRMTLHPLTMVSSIAVLVSAVSGIFALDIQFLAAQGALVRLSVLVFLSGIAALALLFLWKDILRTTIPELSKR